MDIIRVEVDGRELLHDQKEEMLQQLRRAVDAIYGGKATVSLEPNISNLRRNYKAGKRTPVRNIMDFGRKIGRRAGD